ncbi:MAG TPA: LuxR C-terminal-related transcriptional regulator, partial [Roseiflexaceae bacterium]|nr:LuxR C-terminal-related transcriptional regulator [Roseiflexaceae bacterium]
IVPAQRWAATSGLHAEDAPDFARELQHLIFTRVQIATGRQERENAVIDGALMLLERLLVAATSQGRIDSVIEILLLLALAYQAQHRATNALEVLEQALQLAWPEGYMRRFVDEGEPMTALLREANARGIERQYTATLLAACPADRPQVSSVEAMASLPQGETLTEREREVLRLLADGHSNQAIADALVLAVGTVKRHMNNIFAKLDVQSRLQAVARARELDLL